ncbi:MAG: ATP phosphoribosyltransferase regulatory subunit [Anaerolineae bacterium]|nr:ATP phosphoribosyltransferase regulatory subunit [Anaerolineae bacterium]
MSLSTLQQQSAKIRTIEKKLHDHMALYGYDTIELPFIEPSDIFLTRAGDTIIDRLFTFERFGRQLALRPEFTAAAASLYVSSKQTDIVRWQFSGAIFEDEPSNYSLEYQKYSIGAEFIGVNGVASDVETIAMAVGGVSKLGMTNWKLVIGHVGLQLHLLSRYGLDSKTYRMLLSQRDILKNNLRGKEIALRNMKAIVSPKPVNHDNSDTHQQDSSQTQHILNALLDSTRYGTTMGGRTREDIAERLLNKRERALEQHQIEAALDFFAEWVNLRAPIDEAFSQIEKWIGDDADGHAILSDWQQTVVLLESYGIERDQIVIQADLTKNWEYYTGLVFGVEVGEDNYIVGGGRYDELTRILGSEKNIPAIGFAYYVDTMLPLLPVAAKMRNFVVINGEDGSDVIKWARFLRDNQIAVVISLAKDGIMLTIENGRASLNDLSYAFTEKDNLLKDLKAALS